MFRATNIVPTSNEGLMMKIWTWIKQLVCGRDLEVRQDHMMLDVGHLLLRKASKRAHG